MVLFPKISKKSQNARILDYLSKGYSITPLEALDLFGCMRLTSRMHDLRSFYGITFEEEWIKNRRTKKHYKAFSLSEKNQEVAKDIYRRFCVDEARKG